MMDLVDLALGNGTLEGMIAGSQNKVRKRLLRRS